MSFKEEFDDFMIALSSFYYLKYDKFELTEELKEMIEFQANLRKEEINLKDIPSIANMSILVQKGLFDARS